MLETNLQNHFGFSTFRKGQKEVIEKVLDRKSAAAVFPTGSGKSLCYQLPAMMMPNLTLVVSPLISLMQDQVDFLKSRNIYAAKLDSTLSFDEYKKIIGDAKNGSLKILMIAVEKFNNERFRAQLQQMKISLMVIDEAHCISEWGHNFRPEYLKLPIYVKKFKIPQVLLMTATATEEVVDDMCIKFSMTRDNVVNTGFYRPNLFLQITPADENQKKQKLLERVKENPQAPTIIYVTLQKTAVEIAEFLVENGIDAIPYHAGMKHDIRTENQNNFMEGKTNTIVATIAFGMGIDKPDIRRIIHYDMPKSIEEYSQQIGRAGRDGENSLCEILANRDNINILENFIYGDTPTYDDIYNFLSMIQNSNSDELIIQLRKLSVQLNIRQLPLKTLLVYLTIENIISPKTVYYADYRIKIADNETERSIYERFNAERKQFVKSIFDFSQKKVTWYEININRIIENHQGATRTRIINALEYFNDHKWIQLQGKQVSEVFDIIKKHFNIQKTAKKIYELFLHKEQNEINRIHNMISFFESRTCLSYKLAEYFGEHFQGASCGHCSVCSGSPADIQHTTKLKPIEEYNLEAAKESLKENLQENYSEKNLTKFLCGIKTPVFAKYKTTQLENFALLKKYPFKEVENRLLLIS